MNTFQPDGSAPRIEVRIEQVVLHGFAPGDRARIGVALERELTRLIAEQGVPEWLHHPLVMDRFDGGSIELSPGNSADTIGAGIARAVFRGTER